MTERNESGRFLPKGEKARKVRSARLTDATWEKLTRIAAYKGISVGDLLEEVTAGLPDAPGMDSHTFVSCLHHAYQQMVWNTDKQVIEWATPIGFKALWGKMGLSPDEFLQLLERCDHPDLELVPSRGNNWTVANRRVAAVIFHKPAQLSLLDI